MGQVVFSSWSFHLINKHLLYKCPLGYSLLLPVSHHALCPFWEIQLHWLFPDLLVSSLPIFLLVGLCLARQTICMHVSPPHTTTYLSAHSRWKAEAYCNVLCQTALPHKVFHNMSQICHLSIFSLCSWSSMPVCEPTSAISLSIDGPQWPVPWSQALGQPWGLWSWVTY